MSCWLEMDEQAMSAEEQQRVLQRLTTYPHPTAFRITSVRTPKRLTRALGDYGIPLQAVENQLPSFVALMLTTLQTQRRATRLNSRN